MNQQLHSIIDNGKCSRETLGRAKETGSMGAQEVWGHRKCGCPQIPSICGVGQKDYKQWKEAGGDNLAFPLLSSKKEQRAQVRDVERAE